MIDLLTPTPLHLLAALVVLCAMAFLRTAAQRAGRYRWALLALVVWAWLAATPVVAHVLAGWLEAAARPPGHANGSHANAPIVVLASGDAFERSLPGLQLDAASMRRTLCATAVHGESGGRLVFAGRAFPGESPPVAARMARLSERLGVAAGAITVEGASLNTYENLRNVRAMLPDSERIRLVTSAIHMRRALAAAEAVGFDAIPVPCDFRARDDLAWHAWLPAAAPPELLAWALHEWVGWLWYVLRGWA